LVNVYFSDLGNLGDQVSDPDVVFNLQVNMDRLVIRNVGVLLSELLHMDALSCTLRGVRTLTAYVLKDRR
jgi:hypothetical protein